MGLNVEVLIFLYQAIGLCVATRGRSGHSQPNDAPSWSPPFSGLNKYASFDTVQAIAATSNSQIVFGPVEKDLGLFDADRPWEVRIDNGYPNIHYDDSENPAFKLWYDACLETTAGICTMGDMKGTLYATSDDGHNWAKPIIGTTEWLASNANNIVYKGGHGLGVWRDPHEKSSSRKFKAFGQVSPREYGYKLSIETAADKRAFLANLMLDSRQEWRLASGNGYDNHGKRLKKGFILDRRPLNVGHNVLQDLEDLKLPFTAEFFDEEKGGLLASPDGVTWSLVQNLSLGNRWDTHNNMFWDEKHNEYVLITRGSSYASGNKLVRTIARSSSKDFDSGFPPVDIVHSGKSLNDQLYAQMSFPFYSAYLGVVMVYDSEGVGGSAGNQVANDRVRCELAWSPDTYRWFRLATQSGNQFIPITGKRGDMDGYDCFSAKPVVVDNQVWIYFMGGDGPHFGNRNTFLNLAKLRMDGFAGQAPMDNSEAAYLNSKLLKCAQAPLLVNIDVEAGGSAVVTLHDASDAIIGESRTIVANSIETPIVFFNIDKEAVTIPSACRLSFKLKNATLYTFGWNGYTNLV